VIRISLTGIQSLADNKSLILSFSTETPLPQLFGDRDRLVQVITNLLSNSIKFTPQGGSIKIRARHEKLPRPQIVVEISDTGVGISTADLKLIFDKFRRSGDPLTTNSEGAGLGLTITRQIIEYHGGAIWAASDQGYGSTFTFTLPLDKVWNIEGEQQTVSARL
jgi:signal transduction histidine kinase